MSGSEPLIRPESSDTLTGETPTDTSPQHSPRRNYQSMSPTRGGDRQQQSEHAGAAANAPPPRRPQASQPANEEEDELPLDPDKLILYGAKQIISLFVPVTLCMLLVVVVACTVKYYTSTTQYLIYTPFHSADADTGTQVWESLANALIFIVIIAVMTIVLVLLFKYECYRVIHSWLVLTTVMILFFICLIFLIELIRAMNIFLDYVTLALMMWNFGVTGLVMIHWHGPLLMQQSYLIIISAQMALLFLKYLPQWTCWVLLGALAIWDLIAVLCPRGPLRMLVEMAQERQQPIFPALIYSTTAAYMVVKKSGNGGGSDTEESQHLQPQEEEQQHEGNMNAEGAGAGASAGASSDVSFVNEREEAGDSSSRTQRSVEFQDSQRARDAVSALNGSHQTGEQRQQQGNAGMRSLRDIQDDVLSREERGVKLGLGDFVFYSLLMGRAAVDGDLTTIAACYVAILIGMCLTILLLAIAGRALPALPISIACGIVFYFVTSRIITPFVDSLALHRTFL